MARRSSRFFTRFYFKHNAPWYSSGKVQWRLKKNKSDVNSRKKFPRCIQHKMHKPLALHMPMKIHLFLLDEYLETR